MQGGVIGGVCLLAFLLSLGRTDELEGLKELEDRKDVVGDTRDAKETVDLRDLSESEVPDDLKSDISLAVTESNSQDDEERSGTMAQSSSYNYGGSSMSNAVAQSYNGGSASAYGNSYGSSSQSKATAEAGGAQVPPLSPFNSELSPYISPASGLSQAEAQAISDGSGSYGQGLNTYPYSSSYPYTSGTGAAAQAQTNTDSGFYKPSPIATPILSPYNQGLNSAQAQTQASDGFYQPVQRPIPTPILNPYNQGSTQAQADNGLYQPGGNGALNSSPNNQGSSLTRADPADHPIIEPISLPVSRFKQVPNSVSDFPSYPYSPSLNSAPADSVPYQPIPVRDPSFSPYEQFLVPYKESKSSKLQNIIEPISLTASRLKQVSDFSSYPYSPSLSSVQADSVPYQPIPIPDPNFSPYEEFLVPYKESKSAQIQNKNGAYQPVPLINPIEKQLESVPRHNLSLSNAYSPMFKYDIEAQDKNMVYQTIPIPDPNPIPYDSVLVPYKGPSSAITQGNYEPYQPISLSKPYPKQYKDLSKLYNRGSLLPAIALSYSYPKAQGGNDTYQPVPTPVSSSFLVPYRGPDIVHTDTETGNLSQPNPFTYNLKSSSDNPDDQLRSGNNSPALENDFYQNLLSKSGWDSYAYNPYPPSGPNPQLYTSGAEAAQTYAEAKVDATGVVNPYSPGLSQYAVDYPSESPFRPGFNPNESQGPFNVFDSGQTSPTVFEDAKSRLILPFEYVFPNKMPGGENVVQCAKENEFHHFWSRGQDCLVCICLNEYGLLTPVCATCGGCNNPPPKLPEPFPRLPEPVPVQPVTPEPFEPVPVIPESYPPGPQPEPIPPEPIPALYQPVSSPEPNPLYPESVPPSPVPVPYPRPVPTLPPPPPEAMCNPLPSGQPFTNPLHPCQICICRESVASGVPDVQIQCKDNPQCIAPAEVTTLPPIPDGPIPVPLPICEKFPEHVLFPHPTDTCKLCKCSKSLSEGGVPEQLITCYPHPDCIPRLEPVTEPASLVPPPLPIPIEPQKLKPYPEPEPTPIVPVPREPFIPMEPVPLPEIVTVEPLPWPPITTVAPLPTTVPTPVLTPRPGPLPGPSPHESCRPYPPNQAFQHPWDECQLCICTEAFAVGMITVEVNCYTKPSCCVEPPDNLKPALPGYTKPYVGVSNAVNGIDSQSLPSGSQPGIIITTSNRPPMFPSYSPRTVNMYDPGSSQGTSVDTLPQPQGYPPQFTRLPTDDKFSNLPPGYAYQPNYPSGYVSPQYPDYPPRLSSSTNTIGPYNPNSYGFPPTYQYGKEDNVPGNAYPGPPALYQPYDPRYQGASSPNAYPGMYQRKNYEIPSMYLPGQLRDGYGQIQTSAVPGPNAQSIPQSYLGNRVLPRSGNDGPEDSDDSQ